MKGNTVLATVIYALMILPFFGCAAMQTQDEMTDFMVETLAMTIGYEMRKSFEWTPTADQYFNWIMEGKINLDGAKIAEEYLRTVTHVLIANRLVRLASMVGFSLDDLGQVVGVDKVNIKYLQIAAQGFKMGLLLDAPPEA